MFRKPRVINTIKEVSVQAGKPNNILTMATKPELQKLSLNIYLSSGKAILTTIFTHTCEMSRGEVIAVLAYVIEA